MLVWSHYVPAYDVWFDTFCKLWGDKTGVKVRGDHIPHLELPARYAAEFAAGGGRGLRHFVGPIPTGPGHPQCVRLSGLPARLGQEHRGRRGAPTGALAGRATAV